MSSPGLSARTPLAVRFLIYYAVSYLLLIGALGWIVDRQVRETLIDDLEVSLESNAELARLSMPLDPEEMNAWAREVFRASGMRATVIRTDGVVVADSHSDPSIMANHGSRPEVLQALSGGVGTSSRRSESTGFEQHYLALPPDEDSLIFRVSVSDNAVIERVGPVRVRIIWTSVVVGLVGIVLVGLLARRLARPIERIRDTSLAIAEGELERRPQRSPVREIDELGLAIGRLADDLGARLEQSELANETLEVVLGAIPQGTILIGSDERIIYANPVASDIIGAVPGTLTGLTPHPLQTAVRDCRRLGEQVDVVVSSGTPERKIRGVATPFAGEERILLVLVDVTDRERVASVRRDFVANASHELKTPVSSIIAASEALTVAVSRGDDSALGFASSIEQSARQLNRLVSDLLDLSRLERDTPEVEPVQLDHVLKEQIARFSDTASEKGIDLSVDAPPTVVRGNRRDLSIVFGNLIDNAIAYTPPEGSVAVALTTRGDFVEVTVADTGAGIPGRDLDRIFERFYRVDAARSRATGGTGLGLSIVKHSVESHGGTVTASSELGAGSTFTVRLPMT